jgi:DNA-directed RNA polymerase subunit H (RpoH/RPB5)
MLHFSKITAKSKDFHLIASGALAFKIHNKILKDEDFMKGAKVSRNLLPSNAVIKSEGGDQKKVFFVVISDLDKMNATNLCNMIAKERAKGSYAVCQVIPMYYNEPSFKALKMLRQNFDEVIELNKLTLGGGKALVSTEQQHCIITDYSITMARIVRNICVNDHVVKEKEEKKGQVVYA